jgi:hypothetical protein
MTNVPEAGVPETSVPDAPAKNQASELRTEPRPELLNWCEAWKTCLQNVLSQVSGTASGKSVAFELSSQPPPAADSDVWYTVVAGGAVHGEMTLRLPAASGTRLAQKFLGESESAVSEGTTAEKITLENEKALEELLRQIVGLAATALAATAGGEVQLRLSASAAPSWSSDAIVCLQTRNEAGASISLEIRISPALAAELQPRVQPASGEQNGRKSIACQLDSMRQLPRPSDVEFGPMNDVTEMARIASSYTARLSPEALRVSRIGRSIWLRLDVRADDRRSKPCPTATNVLFRLSNDSTRPFPSTRPSRQFHSNPLPRTS